MAKVKGMYQRGQTWWLRYTPAPGKPQERVSLETKIEQVATVKAVGLLQKAPLEWAGAFESEVEEYLAEALRMRRLSPTFIPSRRLTLMAFARDCGITKLSDLSVKVVERWVGMLKEGKGGEGGERKAVKEGTIESYLFSLRAFFGWLVEKNKLRENPALKVELGKVERVVRKNFVSAENVRKLIDSSPTDELRFVLYCGFFCGMRKLEIIEARPDWFQLGVGDRRGRISVGKTATFRTKDRDERTIPLPREFEEFLGRYMKTLPEGAEFMLRPKKKKGKHKYRYDFKRPFQEHLKACGVTASVHDMRRTFVSLKLIQDSSLIFKLAKWTGDDVRVLQDHYGHLLADDEDIETGL